MTSQNEDLQSRLRAHPFLKGMESHHIEVLAQSVTPARFEAGQAICRTGEPTNAFYLVESGAVVIEATKGRPAPVAIDTVSAGDALGWSWLFEPYVWDFDARAIERTTAIRFSARLLRQHSAEDLTLGHELFKRMSEVMVRRLKAAHAKLAEQ